MTTRPSDRSRPADAARRLRAQAQSGSAALPSLDDPPVINTVRPAAEEPLPGVPPPPEPLPGQKSTLGLMKFRDRLPQPPVVRAWEHPQEETITIRAERAPVRYHADLPATEAWTYEGQLPAPTIEVRTGEPVLINWENGLYAERDHRSDHDHDDGYAALAYDVVRVPPEDDVTETIRIANQPGGCVRPDGHGHHSDHPENSYPRLDGTDDIRAATVVHVHGALTDGHNDGWAHNVMLPGHTARCSYPNEQESGTLWYHDHAMAITRFTVFSGLAGLYLVRDHIEESLNLPSQGHEIPLVIADRNLESKPGDADDFRPTGRLLYKQAGTEDDGVEAEVAVSGPFTMVNGRIWPSADVEARWYRFRVLNASNSRIYQLALYDTTEESIPPEVSPLPANDDGGFGDDPQAHGMNRLTDAMVVLGTEGGLLAHPELPPNSVIELGPGERIDILIDFSTLRGRRVELRNENATALNPQPGQIDATALQFDVDRNDCDDPFQLPDTLNPNYTRWWQDDDGSLIVGPDPDTDRIEKYKEVWIGVIPIGTHDNGHPQMWELHDVSDLPEDEIGTTDVIRLAQEGDRPPKVLRAGAKLFDDTIGFLLAENDWALWHIVHLGGPDHPMHIHMTTFQLLQRRSWELQDDGTVPGFDRETGSTPEPLPVPEPGPGIDPITAGTKETWVVRGGEHVTVLGHFAGANGNFMYHCHILDHEDHTMMRPFIVLPESLLSLHQGHGSGGH